MARPRKMRRVCGRPGSGMFKPAGKPVKGMQTTTLTLDEFEALRWSDMEGLGHEAAANRLGVSRPSFTRILNNARKKVATALTLGHALAINGGDVQMTEECIFCCHKCGNKNAIPFGSGKPDKCDACGSDDLFREDV